MDKLSDGTFLWGGGGEGVEPSEGQEGMRKKKMESSVKGVVRVVTGSIRGQTGDRKGKRDGATRIRECRREFSEEENQGLFKTTNLNGW